MLLIRMAWRNVWRHRKRSLITVAAMAAGLVFCMTMTALLDGAFAGMFRSIVTESLGHAQIHHPEYPEKRAMWDTVADAEVLLARLDALPTVHQASARVYGHVLLGFDDNGAGTRVIGVDPVREDALRGLSDRVVSGRYLSPDPRREILLGDALATRLAVQLGDQVVALTQSTDGAPAAELYTVVGTYESGSVALDRRSAFLHAADLQALMVLDGQVHEIAVVAPSPEEVASMVAAVRQALGSSDLLLRSWEEIDPPLAALLDVGDTVSTFLLFVVFGVAALGILNTMLMSVFERTRELGLCRAIGLFPGHVVALILLETASLAGLAVAIGVPLGLAGDAWLVHRGIDLSAWMGDYSVAGAAQEDVVFGVFRLDRVLIAVGGLVGVALVAAIWPAMRAARLRPADAMRTV